MSDLAETLADATDEERDEVMALLGVDDPDDLQGALEQFVAEEFGVEAEQVIEAERTGWNIRDHVDGDPAEAMNLADWAARKHKAALAKIQEVTAIAQRQVEQTIRWREKMTQQQERTAGFFAYLLAQYFTDFHADETSVQLPSGVRLRMRKNRATIQWDEDAALAFAEQKELIECIRRNLTKTRFKETLDKCDDGSYVYRDTGEIVDFVRDVPPEEERSFEIA